MTNRNGIREKKLKRFQATVKVLSTEEVHIFSITALNKRDAEDKLNAQYLTLFNRNDVKYKIVSLSK